MLLCGLMAAAVFALFPVLGLAAFLPAHIQFLNLLLLAAALVTHRITDLGKHKPDLLPNLFLLASVLRMLLSATGLGLFMYLYKIQSRYAGTAVCYFFFLYILYAGMEIKSFRANLRRGSKNQSKI